MARGRPRITRLRSKNKRKRDLSSSRRLSDANLRAQPVAQRRPQVFPCRRTTVVHRTSNEIDRKQQWHRTIRRRGNGSRDSATDCSVLLLRSHVRRTAISRPAVRARHRSPSLSFSLSPRDFFCIIARSRNGRDCTIA